MIKTVATTMLYTYTPEVYSTDLRTTALGFLSAFHRFAPVRGHMIVAVSYASSFRLTALIFSGVYVLGFLVATQLPYDTRDKPLAVEYYRQAHEYAESKRKLN